MSRKHSRDDLRLLLERETATVSVAGTELTLISPPESIAAELRLKLAAIYEGQGESQGVQAANLLNVMAEMIAATIDCDDLSKEDAAVILQKAGGYKALEHPLCTEAMRLLGLDISKEDEEKKQSVSSDSPSTLSPSN